MNLATFFRYGMLGNSSPPLEKTNKFWDYREGLLEYEFLKSQVSIYSKTLHQEDRLGIEVEIEDVNMKDSRKELPPGWFAHQDGSLRGGLEFISPPLPPKSIVDFLSSLYLFLQKELHTKPSFSWRTSIHVHSNVRHFTFEELGNLILLYIVFEQVLFAFGGGNRKNSVFCVPLNSSNMQYLTDVFINFNPSVPRDSLLMLLETSPDKYSALNLKRIQDYGSVEFRHLPGIWDIHKVITWIDMIQALSVAARQMSRPELCDQILNLNTLSTYSQFMLQVFRQELKQYLVVPKNINTMLSEGVTAAKEYLKPPQDMRRTLRNESDMHKYLTKYSERARKIASLSKKKENPQSKKGEGNLSEAFLEDAMLDLAHLGNAVPIHLGVPSVQSQAIQEGAIFWHSPILNQPFVIPDPSIDLGGSESEDSSDEEEEN